MSDSDKSSIWESLNAGARAALEIRDYERPAVAAALGTSGVEAGQLLDRDGLDDVWIPGVEIFARRVFQQRHRGYFGEFAREGEGRLGEIGMWPRQWATALMNSGSAKGFHIHPPHIPKGKKPKTWIRKQFVASPGNYKLRNYDLEQWDAMFFVRGICEMFLIDEREGMERRKMRFLIDGDQKPGVNNVGVVIPPGVAHGLRCASSDDLIMVYGTSTAFKPEFEGRIQSGVEQMELPREWDEYWARN